MGDNLEKKAENITENNAQIEVKTQENEVKAAAPLPSAAQTAVQTAVQSSAVLQQPPRPAQQAAQQNYQPFGNTETEQPVNYYVNQTQCSSQPSKPKKKKGGTAKVVVLALCCALAGGVTGAGAVIGFTHLRSRPEMKNIEMRDAAPGNNQNNGNNQERSANSDANSDSRGSVDNRGGKSGDPKKWSGRNDSRLPNDQQRNQKGGQNDFGRNGPSPSQGGPNSNGTDQGTATQPDNGSDAGNGQNTPVTQPTAPSNGGETNAQN